MANPKFLSLDGVRTLVQWAKDQLATKVDKVAGKDLSDNNYSDDDVAKLESIENGAQSNIIESISVNSVAQAIDDKNVNIAIPLVDDTLTNSGQSADAKATGDAIAEVNQSLSQTATAIRQEFDDADNQLAEEMTQALEELSGTIPTKTSELTNDSDYTTKGYVDDEIADTVAAIPTKTSQITNDSDFTTKQYVDGELDTLEASIPTKVSQLQNDSSYATTTQLTDGLATKEDTLQYGTATAEDVGKAMMPKTVTDGKVTSWEFGEAGKVDDVQVNGTSILNNKVANIPLATASNLGVVRSNSDGGIVVGNGGLLRTDPASTTHAKQGGNNYKPITPATEHAATFYGLAKAAGDTTQSSSSNAVGTYTDSAKTAIQSMLGIDTAIADAVGNITSFEFQVVTELPAIGIKGIIYLRAHFHEDNDVYDEYIWVTDRYERLGTLDVDLSNYVTFDDYATVNKAGVVRPFNDYGTNVNATGRIMIYKSPDNAIANGTDNYRPIVPSNQHISSFYGLAKSAGDTTQSQSSNAVGQYTDEAKSAIQSMLGVPSKNDVVTDVQVNGTSVVTDGVAEIPVVSTNSKLGLVQTNSLYGIAAFGNGFIGINKADQNQEKLGVENNRPIVPSNQHISTFYGLAKAAGDTTQSASDNPVGTYTDEAKTAIKNMIGITDPETITNAQIDTLFA